VPLDDLSNIFLGPDDEPPNRARKKARTRVGRLPPLPGPHVRVLTQWLSHPRREHVFQAEQRLFLYVLYRSHWGQLGVTLTRAAIAEIGAPRRTLYDAICRLERKGWIRVERRPGRVLVVWPEGLAA
jgi:hypothetical protein